MDMKRYKSICAMLLCLFFMLSGCMQEKGRGNISDVIGIDITNRAATTIETAANGVYYKIFTFFEEFAEEEIAQSPQWKPLPMDDVLETLLYGIDTGEVSFGPYITREDGQPIFPRVEHGYVFFLDRHAKSTDPQSDAAVLTRHSFNFTIAVFDTDQNTLYYCEFDT